MIAQQDDFGCSVACVANLLGLSYSQALRLFDKPENAKTKGFTCRDIVDALNKYDYPTHYKYLKPKLRSRIYEPGTIAFIARSKKYPAGHYLLRVNSGWADPWINLPIDKNVKKAKAGYRKRLPGKPIYAIF